MINYQIVVTTIQPPTDCMVQWSNAVRRLGLRIWVIGDKKGPESYPISGCELICYNEQETLGLILAPMLPFGCYARKNIGYLLAIRSGAQAIYETDDDNAPEAHWRVRSLITECMKIDLPGWVNAYRYFTDRRIWPRGFPLAEIKNIREKSTAAIIARAAPIQQGLANGSPDVDAIWRLLFDEDVKFDLGPSLYLSPGTWCPFNSQNTWWFRDVFVLLYLPVNCSFRMTDIWRGLVAQRCLWTLGYGVVFHSADVYQKRNKHSLQRDFEEEVPGYKLNGVIADTLSQIDLPLGAIHLVENFRRCYSTLVNSGVFPPEELILVDAWLLDLKMAQGKAVSDAGGIGPHEVCPHLVAQN